MEVNRPRKPLELRPTLGADPPATAMVMAAGLGKRMRPLTATRPKPLVEVAGKTLLDHSIDRLKAAGVKRVVVNVHHFADALEAHLNNRVKGIDVVVSDERKQLMETGGGMVQAQHLIPDDPFILVNSDNVWVDGPADSFRLLAARWDDAVMDALLLMVPLARAGNHSGRGDFYMDAGGGLSRKKPGRIAPFVWTGIQMVSKRLLADPPSGPFSTNILWDRAIAAGRCFGMVHQGLWFDVGTPGAIPPTEAALAGG
jgi:N-acetyl-alpha-D-muramate 1-phosphate uridylyltransferase